MADIAAVFHWPPQSMDPMSPEELARWWAKARARSAPPDVSEG
ncbi:hypothetical protein RSWS8N_18239 [Cereibacter sphaeroides WS8N]|nr:GpE family phage tail protein [Cereibacter sphaeroides]EGJ20126.1 hypothetical protein RSWS8N_18239 [Cereibacter sphaeroides WS8N]